MPELIAKRRGTDPKTLFVDKLANLGIRVGGIAIIAAVLGIFIFIFVSILPLFQAAKLSAPRTLGPSRSLAFFVDEHKEKAVFLSADAVASSYDLASQTLERQWRLRGAGSAKFSAAFSDNKQRLALGTVDGRAWLAQAGFHTRFDKDHRIQEAFIDRGELRRLDTKGKAIKALSRGGENPLLLAALTVDGRAVLNLDKKNFELALPEGAGKPLAVLVPESADRVLIGTALGHLLSFSLGAKGWILDQDFQAFQAEALCALGYPVGQQSVLCGGARGSLLSAFLVEAPQGRVYQAIHHFDSLDSAVLGLASSPRDKGFCAVSEKGELGLYFLTNERTLYKKPLPFASASGWLNMSPKSDGILVQDAARGSWLLDVANPHPEVNAKALFSKIWYEGYDKPDYVWQSTGGSDDFEPKFSLTPLIYGTLKGTFYALLFAVPLAILGALYTSQFMSRRLRGYVKPVIEIMAAVPSVVMGFLAGLLLAPFIEKNLLTLLLGVAVVPLTVLATLWFWRSAPKHFSRHIHEDSEIVVLMLGLAIGISLLFVLGPLAEKVFFLDFKVWMRNHWSVNYDQRNSLVVGFAMGFAVIPIIYTICEDALASVPRHLVSASLSCGATPWQTAVHVVLPVALSGIFSAVMVGFGRAVGETMIVLMATGNTPVMDFSAFNGFRALSANIAVEIPEAPMGGSLYRILFFAALLLFLMTFVVNSVAELIRLHLRKKYSQL